MGTAMFAMFLMLTLYMQQVLGYSAMKTGVGYLAVAGTAIFTSAIAAQLVTRDRREAGVADRDDVAHSGPRRTSRRSRWAARTWATCCRASC